MESDNVQDYSIIKIKEEIVDVEIDEKPVLSQRLEFDLVGDGSIDFGSLPETSTKIESTGENTYDSSGEGVEISIIHAETYEQFSNEDSNQTSYDLNVPKVQEVLQRILLYTAKDFKNEKNEQLEFRCEICNVICTRLSRLKDHVMSHTDLRPFVCPHCDKTFKQSSSLSFHLKTHLGDKPFSCEVCGKAFIRKYLLLEHLLTHDDDRPFPCDHCNKPFKTKRSLTAHLRAVAEGRSFPCSHCDKIFSTKYNLQMHIKLLGGERPFTCEYCPKKFKLRNHLKAHLRLHSEEHPFKCKRCGRGFQFIDHLKAHMRWHNDTFKNSTGAVPHDDSTMDPFPFSELPSNVSTSNKPS